MNSLPKAWKQIATRRLHSPDNWVPMPNAICTVEEATIQKTMGRMDTRESPAGKLTVFEVRSL